MESQREDDRTGKGQAGKPAMNPCSGSHDLPLGSVVTMLHDAPLRRLHASNAPPPRMRANVEGSGTAACEIEKVPLAAVGVGWGT